MTSEQDQCLNTCCFTDGGKRDARGHGVRQTETSPSHIGDLTHKLRSCLESNFKRNLNISKELDGRCSKQLLEAIQVKFVKHLSALSHGTLACFAINKRLNECIPSGPSTDMFEVIHYWMVDIPLHIYLSDALQTIQWPRGRIERIIYNKQTETISLGAIFQDNGYTGVQLPLSMHKEDWQKYIGFLLKCH